MNAETTIKLACKGNPDAERFCFAWAEFSHLLDDIYDKDQIVSDERLASTFTTWILELSGNSFFLAHRAQLVSLMVIAANSWIDANRCGRATVQAAAQQDVLKGNWHEVIFFVAFTLGGWKHLRMVTSEAREYSFEPWKGSGQ